MSANATLKLYGIKNCDTMKKAMLWLSDNGVGFEFIDYKKPGVVGDRLPHWLAVAGADVLLNRRGLMWKKLSESERENVDAKKAAGLMTTYPALIKRPVLEIGNELLVGFDPVVYSQRFAKD